MSTHINKSDVIKVLKIVANLKVLLKYYMIEYGI